MIIVVENCTCEVCDRPTQGKMVVQCGVERESPVISVVVGPVISMRVVDVVAFNARWRDEVVGEPEVCEGRFGLHCGLVEAVLTDNANFFSI